MNILNNKNQFYNEMIKILQKLILTVNEKGDKPPGNFSPGNIV